MLEGRSSTLARLAEGPVSLGDPVAAGELTEVSRLRSAESGGPLSVVLPRFPFNPIVTVSEVGVGIAGAGGGTGEGSWNPASLTT